MEQIFTQKIHHKTEERLKLFFKYNETNFKIVKKLPTLRYSSSLKVWHISADLNIEELNKILTPDLQIITKNQINNQEKNQILDTKINQNSINQKHHCPVVEHYKQSIALKKLSERTAEIYVSIFEKFVQHFGDFKIEKFGYLQIKQYIEQTTYINSLSLEQYKQLISAIKYYYEKILGQPKLYFKYEQKKDIVNISTVL